MGRQTKVTAPGGVVTNTAYYPTGEVRRVDGATYPVEYTYNGLGKQATMTTFKDANTLQVTTWIYNNRGNLASKKYPDNNGPSYTYNADGNLLTRTWERNITTNKM
jgi:YD repeat-containing protein